MAQGTITEPTGTRPQTLIAYYRLTNDGPMAGWKDCIVCLDEAPVIGIVGKRCWYAACEMAAMDETDGREPASIEGITLALYGMECVTNARLAPVPGHDPVKWAHGSAPLAHMASPRTAEQFGGVR